jgi:hypothetical protein
VALAKSVKYARDQARGESGDAVGLAATKMKKVVARRQQVGVICQYVIFKKLDKICLFIYIPWTKSCLHIS